MRRWPLWASCWCSPRPRVPSSSLPPIARCVHISRPLSACTVVPSREPLSSTHHPPRTTQHKKTRQLLLRPNPTAAASTPAATRAASASPLWGANAAAANEAPVVAGKREQLVGASKFVRVNPKSDRFQVLGYVLCSALFPTTCFLCFVLYGTRWNAPRD